MSRYHRWHNSWWMLPVKVVAGLLFLLGLALVGGGAVETVRLLVVGDESGDLRNAILSVPVGAALLVPGLWLFGG